MTTTSLEAPGSTASGGGVIPFPFERGGFTPAAVRRTLAALAPRVARGEGAAMLALLVQARRWWDAFPVLAEHSPCGGDDMGWLTHGWCDAWRMVAEAPALDRAAVLAKAELGVLWADSGSEGAPWCGALAETLLDGVRRLVAEAGGPTHE